MSLCRGTFSYGAVDVESFVVASVVVESLLWSLCRGKKYCGVFVVESLLWNLCR